MNPTLAVVRIDIILTLLRDAYASQYRAMAGLAVGDPSDWDEPIATLEAEFARIVESAQGTADEILNNLARKEMQ